MAPMRAGPRDDEPPHAMMSRRCKQSNSEMSYIEIRRALRPCFLASAAHANNGRMKIPQR
jgi:hypothetical protein